MASAAVSVTDTGLTDPDGWAVLAVRGRGISGPVAVRLRHREPDYHSGFGGWYLDIRLSPRLSADRQHRDYLSVHRRDYWGYLSVVAESESHPRARGTWSPPPVGALKEFAVHRRDQGAYTSAAYTALTGLARHILTDWCTEARLTAAKTARTPSAAVDPRPRTWQDHVIASDRRKRAFIKAFAAIAGRDSDPDPVALTDTELDTFAVIAFVAKAEEHGFTLSTGQPTGQTDGPAAEDPPTAPGVEGAGL